MLLPGAGGSHGSGSLSFARSGHTLQQEHIVYRIRQFRDAEGFLQEWGAFEKNVASASAVVGASGHKQYTDRWILLGQLAGQAMSVLSRHDQVGEHEIELALLFDADFSPLSKACFKVLGGSAQAHAELRGHRDEQRASGDGENA